MVYIALFWILSTFYEEVYNQVDLVYIYIYGLYGLSSTSYKERYRKEVAHSGL